MLLAVVIAVVLGAAIAAAVALFDDEGATDGAGPPGSGAGACDGPPTVALAVDLADGAPEVFVVRPDQPPAAVLPGQVAHEPAAAPTGDRLAVTVADGDYESAGPEGSTITVVGVDGAGPQALTPTTIGVEDQTPAWSPDGATIVFGRSDFTEPAPAGWSLLTVPSEGGEPTELVGAEGPLVRVQAPAWSPDGERIAYVRSVDEPDGSARATSVWVVGADGSAPRELAPVPDLAVVLDWSPDGTHLLAVPRFPGDGLPMEVIDIATGEVASVDEAPGSARWSTRAGRVVGLTRDGDVVEQALDGATLGDSEVLLAHDDLPESTFEDGGFPGFPEDVAVVPCRT